MSDLFMPLQYETEAEPPDLVMGYVSVTSQGGTSILAADAPTTAEPFRGTKGDRDEAERIVSSVGLEVEADSSLGCAVSGPPGAFEELTGGKLHAVERLVHAEAGRRRYVTYLDIAGPDQPEAVGVGLAHSTKAPIEAVILERPRFPLAVFPSPLPPSVTKYHLRVPDDVALLLGAFRAHRDGRLGEGVTVAMVDSGQYAHPFFISHGYDVRPTVTVVPGTSPGKDPIGHGTGESANIFALAPAATLRPYRATDSAGRLVGAITAFVRAKQANPQILTNSWGGDGPYPPQGPMDPADRAWAAEIADAVEQGIVVVFAAGNGSFSIEPQVPSVLAAGGTFVNAALDLRASNYASGYDSPYYAGRTVPDLCGLVGQLPRAQYLMLPIPPGCEIDLDEAQAASGDTPDGTAPRDGWALFSGTSAAAPQLAGAAAMILGAAPGLTPEQVRQAMVETAVDVRLGRCNPRFDLAARTGPDSATGAGLLNASAAVERALAL
jgi:subtilisin family serine protease